jgi:hypothetical protein
MADLKISALTSASTPLAGTEVLPLVQSSTTKKVAVSDLTAGRAVAGLSFTATKVGNDAFIKVENSGGGAAGAWYFVDSVDLNYMGTVLQSAGVEKWFAGSYGTSAYQIKSGGRSGTEAFRVETSNDVKVSVGNLVIGTSGNGLTSTGTITCKSSSAGIDWAVYSAASSTNPAYFIQGNGTVNGIGTGASGSASAMYVNRDTGSLRSINAAGSLNASGADYAEYMVKDGDFVIAKGDICGVKANGKLTNVFADAVSFVVKSTDPSYVGGDTWFNEQAPQPPVELTAPNKDATDEEKAKYEFDLVTYNSDFATYTADLADWKQRLEVARAPVDRIAFCGQVPVNVQGATPGQFIVPTDDNGAIKGVAVSNPTFEQYQAAIGKVIAVEADGRAKIIVKIA